MRRKSKPVPGPQIDLSHHVTDTSRKGELVRIHGEHGLFRLRSAVTNTTLGVSWVELFGPLGKGSAQFRAVRPAMVRPATKAEIRRSGIVVPS